ncbi:IclR family transcriptional regulator [Haloterrigena sp. SYSU A121-1]|uniref:IclR family transcriptional regulator n=1 Tax=Haloterrigena gelatinilytica TaxID=2741724 RepID=A0A8J8GP81_9EURY|nr:IclR family transcriptional regulator [Haloterrigena gelatinilytica]NUB93773.1 IclR family transcriptional regulator [Haloterrigena gelatinilytica]
MSTDTPRRVDAVRRTGRIIEALQRRGSAGVTELADEVEFSKSTVHEHLATLAEEGMVVKDGHAYRLSLRFLDIAEAVKRTIAEHDIVCEQVRELADATGEVVHFGAKEAGCVVYIEKSKGDAVVQTEAKVGDRMPMHSTALGKSILAELPAEDVERIAAEYGLEKRTGYTITSLDELQAELEKTASRGYSIDDEENIPGMRCIGMAVSLPETETIGALGVSGPSQRMTDDRIETELRSKLARAANTIEVNSLHS